MAWLTCSYTIQITRVKPFSASLLSGTEKCLCVQHVCHINNDIHVSISIIFPHQHKIYMFHFLHLFKECTEWYNWQHSKTELSLKYLFQHSPKQSCIKSSDCGTYSAEESAYKVFVWKVREIDKFKDLGIAGTIILKWYLKEAGREPVDWIHLTGSCEIYVTLVLQWFQIVYHSSQSSPCHHVGITNGKGTANANISDGSQRQKHGHDGTVNSYHHLK